MDNNTTLTASIGRTLYQTIAHARTHQVVSDEPTVNGGGDTGPTPSELILAALASCTGATLRMYADRKGWDLAQVDIALEMSIEKNGSAQTTRIKRTLSFSGNLSDEERTRLLEIADKCPVHKLLTNEVIIEAV
jgi:putative redox protein